MVTERFPIEETPARTDYELEGRLNRWTQMTAKKFWFDVAKNPKPAEVFYRGEVFYVIKAMEFDQKLPTLLVGLGIDVHDAGLNRSQEIFELYDRVQSGAANPTFNLWLIDHKPQPSDRSNKEPEALTDPVHQDLYAIADRCHRQVVKNGRGKFIVMGHSLQAVEWLHTLIHPVIQAIEGHHEASQPEEIISINEREANLEELTNLPLFRMLQETFSAFYLHATTPLVEHANPKYAFAIQRLADWFDIPILDRLLLKLATREIITNGSISKAQMEQSYLTRVRTLQAMSKNYTQAQPDIEHTLENRPRIAPHTDPDTIAGKLSQLRHDAGIKNNQREEIAYRIRQKRRKAGILDLDKREFIMPSDPTVGTIALRRLVARVFKSKPLIPPAYIIQNPADKTMRDEAVQEFLNHPVLKAIFETLFKYISLNGAGNAKAQHHTYLFPQSIEMLKQEIAGLV